MLVLNADTGVNKIQDGTVTDTKLTLTANSAEVKTALNASGAAPIYACRAWVNFNGTGTVAIRASGNVSSITDNGVGDYTVNFTTAMIDDNYSVSTTAQVPVDQSSPYQFGLYAPVGSGVTGNVGLKTTTQVRMLHRRESSFDINNANVSIFR